MRRRRLFWQLYPSYLLITLPTLLTVVLYGSGALRDFYYDRVAEDLESRAWLLEEQIAAQLPPEGPIADSKALEQARRAIDPLCKRLGEKLAEKLGHESSTRITVVWPSGKVVGDSEGSPADMDNHARREEIQHAMAGRIRRSVRTSPTLRLKMMYLAIPIQRREETIGILRTSIPVTEIDHATWEIQWKIAIAGLVVVVIAAGVGLVISRRISRPLERLRHAAERLARGDLSERLPTGDSQEIASLADTINQMAAELDWRIRTALRERNQREAILSSMVEGVLAVDARQRLISLNQAGANLLNVDAEAVLGRSLQDIVRNPELEKLLADVLRDGRPIEDEFVLDEGDRERFLSAQGTVLHDVEAADTREHQTGALVVLHDVTRLKRLENVRRDFVANVSHELKTPITSIKGFAETLLDGAVDRPEDAKRFLRILAAQSDRLNDIIEDLLTLSRLERETGKVKLPVEQRKVRDVLEAAIGVCELHASEKHVRIELTCDDQLYVQINADLLEQAVVNLVDNAVKYSPKGATVLLQADHNEAELVIRVRDHGCGIGPEHLPRLFERFYRADKARSRKLGGTGLGLAIVKHIAQAHGGRAEVQSTPDEGSVFSLHLPL